jgi:hypothetical protein
VHFSGPLREVSHRSGDLNAIILTNNQSRCDSNMSSFLGELLMFQTTARSKKIVKEKMVVLLSSSLLLENSYLKLVLNCNCKKGIINPGDGAYIDNFLGFFCFVMGEIYLKVIDLAVSLLHYTC